VSTEEQTGETPTGTCALRVQVVFHLTDDQQSQSVAARMIDSAHEIANLPECECDVDVSVELTNADGAYASPAPSGAPGRVGHVEH
jgi:hypothetical protein